MGVMAKNCGCIARVWSGGLPRVDMGKKFTVIAGNTRSKNTARALSVTRIGGYKFIRGSMKK